MSESGRPPLVLIAGPTASGKSALALQVADRTGGVIVNADSAQLYRDLKILSARPQEPELARAEHRLYGVLDGSRPCSAADWAGMARTEIGDIHASGRLPIIVGGTGLYLRSLIEGIAPVPNIDVEVRKRIRGRSVHANRDELERHDPEAAARLNPADTTRIARALEVALSTGRPLADWQKEREGGIGTDVTLKPLILLPPRDWLYRRCDTRFTQMIELGALTEVERLIARNLDGGLPVMRAIGVREIAAFLHGEATLADAVAAGQQETRRYAKRQYTWFAHQPPASWPRFLEPLDTGVEQALELLAARA